METHRIFIVGDTLFAEMLAQLLSQNPGIEVLGSAPDLESVVPLLSSSSPDAVVYAKKPEQDEPVFSSFITNNPDLPVLCTELSKNAVQVVVSQNIYVHSSKDLLTIIQTLRKRR